MECITKCVCSIVLSSCLSMVLGSDNKGNISIGSFFYVMTTRLRTMQQWCYLSILISVKSEIISVNFSFWHVTILLIYHWIILSRKFDTLYNYSESPINMWLYLYKKEIVNWYIVHVVNLCNNNVLVLLRQFLIYMVFRITRVIYQLDLFFMLS
jgi:hypothetical protein